MTDAFKKVLYMGHGPNFIQVAEGILRSFGTDALAMFMCRARQIWFRCNEVVHGGLFTHPNTVVCNTSQAYDDFQTLNTARETGSQERGVVQNASWQPPQEGWIKVNWDIGLDVMMERYGVGMVLRNHAGRVIAAKSVTRVGSPNPSR